MVLRQPGGNLLAILLDAGGGGTMEDMGMPGFHRGRQQLGAWGFAAFGDAGGNRITFRVTPLGRAAHAWGWASVARGGACRAGLSETA